MNELDIVVKDCLTNIACSKLVIKIIKHILYNTQQVPFNYELLSRMMKSRNLKLDPLGDENADEISPANSYKEMLTQHFLKKIHFIFNNFENTFKNLEVEFAENGGVKEIIIMIGTTMLMPKKVFRIDIPLLLHCNCVANCSFDRNCMTACRNMFNSEELHSYLNDQILPMNVYILIKMAAGVFPKTEWFLPNESFRIPNVKQMFIKIKQPKNINCTCSVYTSNTSLPQESLNKNIVEETVIYDGNNGHLSWYQPKENLKGFKDSKVKGVSALNTLKV